MDYVPPEELPTHEKTVDKQRAALNNVLDALGSKQKNFKTDNYTHLTHRMKLKYIRLLRFLIKSVAFFMAGSDSAVLIRKVCDDMNSEDVSIHLDGSFCQILGGISEAYTNADSWQS